jgi:hypothetical protein
MGKPLKETSFFGGNRRKTELGSWQVLQSRAGEKHMKFAFEMGLSGENIVAMPEWIGDAFEAMEHDGSAIGRSTLNRILEGMTMEIFPTDKHKRPTLSLTGATIKNLYLLRSGEEDDAEVVLHMTIYSPANVQARDWAWDTLRGTFWAAFEYSQTEMDFSGSADKEDGDEDDPAYAGENKNTMAPERDEEFRSPGTRKTRGSTKELATV